HGDAAQPAVGRLQALHKIGIVGAEKARLHQHAIGDAVLVELLQIERERRVVVGRVPAARRELQPAMKDVGVGIDRQFRHLSPHLARQSAGRQRGNHPRGKPAPRQAMFVRCHDHSPSSRARSGGLLENLAAGFRQHQHGDQHQRIGESRVDPDRGTKADVIAEIADQERKRRRDDAA
ncbi:hypothetical protein chiPu_0033414, partial [Chiloscyllium punctatum]|nr:hypothetical protein [Chiloscyllium punctatum]